MPPFRSGADALQEALDRAKGSGDRIETNFFKWEDGETKYLRFLTDIDKLLIIQVHDYYRTPSGKHKGFVCRREVGESCEICERDPDSRKREFGYGLAVQRQEIREDGKIVGYKDLVEEGDDGKVKPVVGVIRQAPSNFWIYLQNLQQRRGSLRDYDVEIVRKGDDKSTIYMCYDCDIRVEIPNLDGRYAKFVPDLGGMLERMASAEYYQRWLHGDGDDDSEESSSSRASTRVSNTGADRGSVEETEFDRLRREHQRIQAEADAAPVGDMEYS